MSKVRVRGLTEIAPALEEESVTVRDGEGSLLNFTFIVAVEPSLTVVDAAERIMFIRLVSTVEMEVVEVPKSVPFPVIVTVSEAVFVSARAVRITVCGTFQLAALKFKLVGAMVTAVRLLDVRFIVLAVPGFPESATVNTLVEPSVIVAPPLNTAFESLSVVSKLIVAFVTAGADAVIVTVSVVSLISSTPVTVIVLKLLQQFAPGQTLSNVTEAGATVAEATLEEAKLTTKEGDGS